MSPALASNSYGDAAIAWSAAEADITGHPTSPYFIQLVRRSSSGDFGPAIDLMSESESSPVVAMDANRVRLSRSRRDRTGH